ncbi:hypothetical protein [Roseateles chitinivorans]|nr:hypothetical protein [Roseateles chitinivorans]
MPSNNSFKTAPRFANYRERFSSDILLEQMALGPTVTQKRLGDNFTSSA